MVPITVHASVMSVIERGEDAMFDQRANAVVTEFIAEGFRIVATISGETLQVVRRNTGDLRADLRIVFLRGRRVNVGDVQRFDIHECRDFQRSNAIVRAVA